MRGDQVWWLHRVSPSCRLLPSSCRPIGGPAAGIPATTQWPLIYLKSKRIMSLAVTNPVPSSVLTNEQSLVSSRTKYWPAGTLPTAQPTPQRPYRNRTTRSPHQPTTSLTHQPLKCRNQLPGWVEQKSQARTRSASYSYCVIL